MSTKEPDQKETQGTERAGERHRDEQRDHAGPQYGGDNWAAADKRGDQRFGEARNDDADPLTLTKGDKDVKDADGAVEAGGEHAGMGRGETPRKS